MKMPMMTAKCICFAGNNVGSKVFRDKVNDADMEGNLLHQYDTIMDFFTRNLHNVHHANWRRYNEFIFIVIVRLKSCGNVLQVPSFFS